MMVRFLSVSILATLLLAFSVDSPVAAEDSAQKTANGIAFFEAKIRPVLVKHCYECHAMDSDEIEGSLLLDSKMGLEEGGDSGPAVVANDLEESLLINALEFEDFEMPPSGKLPPEVISDFRKWIQMGAPDPRSQQVKLPQEKQPSALTADQLWSLRSVEKPPAPKPKDKDWPNSDIDCFVRLKLEDAELQPVADAEPLSIMRRIYFDLMGLPPTPEEVEEFKQTYGESPNEAFEEIVDRLLDSEHFGERWGRHWLDVARYAESNGKSRDVLFPYAWRYRNWVIDAFNDDLPFDQFVTQQIAGDLLETESTEQQKDFQIATGLLAIGSKPLVGGSLQQDMVDDQIDVVTRGFLGLTASCARCHDHKFDPIPTADYYSLSGIFNSTKTFYGGGPKRPKSTVEAAKLWMVLGEVDPELMKEADAASKKIVAAKKRRNAAAKRLAKIKTSAAKKSNGKKLIADAEATVAKLDKQIAELNKSMKSLNLELAMGVTESGKPADSPILIRGEKNQRGKVIPRGFLSAVDCGMEPEIPGDASGRLQLAQWISHPSNPLTARVAVNRIWYHLFGRGLVETVDNFGANGTKPSHPKLLDHLALRFVENGWSTKTLIRDIMMSRTYRLSTEFNDAAFQKDPENILLWRANRRRVEVEVLRDSLLSAGGTLESERPSRSVVAEIGEGEVGRGINERPLQADFYHRSVYLPILRTSLSELLKTFDFPDPSNLQGRRIITNVPTQSLYLMNSPLVIEQAEGLAKRALNARTLPHEQVKYAYLASFGRPASQDESQAALEFIAKSLPQQETGSEDDQLRLEAWTTFCQALFASAEFRFID